MFGNLFNKKETANTISFDQREFVLFWMVAAFHANIPGDISAYQMDMLGAAMGVDFAESVMSITPEEFNAAQDRFDAALQKNGGN